MKTLKRALCLLLVFATMCSLFVGSASAASTTPYDALSSSRYAKVYTLATSGRQTVYTKSDLKTPGNNKGACNAWIDCAADELWLMDVGVTNGQYWAFVSYPVSGGRRTGYIPLSAITANSHAVKSTSSGKFYCSPRLGKAVSSSYYVAKSDVVWLVAVNGSQVQLLYPTNSGYRLAWAAKSDYEKYCGTLSNEPVDVTAQFAGKTITIRSVENGKYLCAEGNETYVPLCANRSSASTWETFTVSKLTSDGWVGIQAYNGKFLSAAANATNTPIRAVASKLQSWECFRIYKKGNDYYLKAQVNGKWLCTRVDRSNAPVQAYASAASTWERFAIHIISSKEEDQHDTFSPVWPCQNARYISTMYRYWNGGNVKNHGCESNMYNGFDIAGSSGDTIYAIESGTVVDKGYSSGSFGNYVIIEHANGLRSLYAHMKYAACVNKGDTVTRGQTIGYMGTTGNSTGNHLHFEVYNPNNHSQVINPWVTWYQGKISVTIGGNSYRANSKYPNDAAAKAWCNWLTNNCKKNSSGDYVFTA